MGSVCLREINITLPRKEVRRRLINFFKRFSSVESVWLGLHGRAVVTFFGRFDASQVEGLLFLGKPLMVSKSERLLSEGTKLLFLKEININGLDELSLNKHALSLIQKIRHVANKQVIFFNFICFKRCEEFYNYCEGFIVCKDKKYQLFLGIKLANTKQEEV